MNIPLNLAIEEVKNRWTYIEKVTRISSSEFISAILCIDSNLFYFW